MSGWHGAGSVLSAPATAQRWRAVDHCTGTPQTTWPYEQVRTTASRDCPVILYTVIGAGHTWPGGLQYLPPVVIGATDRSFDAGRTIWDFFQHRAI